MSGNLRGRGVANILRVNPQTGVDDRVHAVAERVQNYKSKNHVMEVFVPNGRSKAGSGEEALTTSMITALQPRGFCGAVKKKVKKVKWEDAYVVRILIVC